MARGLRIVGGEHSGRQLAAPPGARPTGERTREALASALDARGLIDGGRVLDLFAGSGALGLEMLSRGAVSLCAVDRDRRACTCIRDNADKLGLADRVSVVCEDLIGRRDRSLARLAQQAAPFDLVLADPPYALANELPMLVAALHTAGLLARGAAVALEHPATTTLTPPEGLSPLASYRHGDTALCLWVASEDDS